MDAAPDQQRLRNIFNRCAAKAVRDYPQLANGFLIYSPLTQSFHGVQPADKELAARIFEHYPQQAAAWLKERPDLAGSITDFDDVPVMLLAKATHHAYTPKQGPVEDEVLRLFLHELGHRVAPGGNTHSAGGTGSRARRESIADTYSYLNDPGHETPQGRRDWQELVLWQRSSAFVFTDVRNYFTAPVLEAAMDLETRHDLSRLGASDKATLSYRLALLAQPEEAQVAALSDIFKPAREAMDQSAMAGYRKLADILFADHGTLSDAVYRAGRAALLPALERKNDILETRLTGDDIKTLSFDGRDWELIRVKIAARDQTQRKLSAMTVEANDMFVLGFFDRPPGSRPDPAIYEGKDNLAHLERCYSIFGEIRRLQTSGKQASAGIAALLPPDAAGLTLYDTAQLSSRIAGSLAQRLVAGPVVS